MSGDTNGDKLQLCRLCLAQTATTFSLVEGGEAPAMLEALTSLRITPADEISTVMCLKCRLNLTLAFKIQQSMLHAERRFREDHAESTIKEEPGTIKQEPECEPPKPPDPGFHCDICGKTMTTNGNLRRHKFFIHNEPQQRSPKPLLTCDICGKDNFTRQALSKHQYNVHTTFECPTCGKRITSTNFKRHVERHNDPLAVCDICGATCKKQDLRVHMYRHEKSYECQFCGKVYKNKTTRSDHEKREHLDVADFVCDTCGKKFYKSIDLKKHVNSKHLKLRPHICDFCGVGFSSKGALRTHRRQHTNETPYKCDVCGDGFRQKVSLKAHLRSKHDIKEELTCECDKCGKRFGSKAALTAHSRVH